MKTFASTASRIRAWATALRALSAVCAVLSVTYLSYILMRPASQPPRNLPVASQTPRIETSERAKWITVLESRPLRKVEAPPPPIVKAPPPAKPPNAPAIEVVGTMVNPGQTPRAFLRSKATGEKLLTVQPGKLIDGAMVKEIADGQITVEVEGHAFVIKVARKSR